jgi:hypothetical protein
MEQNGRPRRRFEAPSAPTTLTECARRYHAAALALARMFGVPLTLDFVREYHPAISTIYQRSAPSISNAARWACACPSACSSRRWRLRDLPHPRPSPTAILSP